MIAGRIARWLENRLPPSDSHTLAQNNIYIVPTKAGLAFALTLLLMLVASINYQLNLGYLLTFLLAGSALVSIHLTHATLRGLTLRVKPPAPVFLGDSAELDIVLNNPGAARHGIGLAVRKHLLAERGVIASAALRKPGPRLSAADIADIAHLVTRQTRRLADLG